MMGKYPMTSDEDPFLMASIIRSSFCFMAMPGRRDLGRDADGRFVAQALMETTDVTENIEVHEILARRWRAKIAADHGGTCGCHDECRAIKKVEKHMSAVRELECPALAHDKPRASRVALVNGDPVRSASDLNLDAADFRGLPCVREEERVGSLPAAIPVVAEVEAGNIARPYRVVSERHAHQGGAFAATSQGRPERFDLVQRRGKAADRILKAVRVRHLVSPDAALRGLGA